MIITVVINNGQKQEKINSEEVEIKFNIIYHSFNGRKQENQSNEEVEIKFDIIYHAFN